MDGDAGSPMTDYILPVLMVTTATQTDECALDDEDDVDFVDYYPSAGSCQQQYAFYDRL